MTKKLFQFDSGIYQIRNLVNNKIYIGQSSWLSTRRYNHFRLLGLNKEHNIHLQSAYNKYGKENFAFEVILFCDVRNLDFYEQLFVDNLHPQYNFRKDVTSNRGHKVSEETKRKISLSQIGKIVSDITRRNMSKAHETRTQYMSNNARKAQSERMKMGKGFHPLSRFTPNDVLEIRKMRNELKMSCIEIGKMFNVDRGVIYNICKYKTWKHVP